MFEFSTAAKYLWAKKDRHGSLQWLPLAIHMQDCAEVARLLWRDWLPDGVKNLICSNLYPSVSIKGNLIVEDNEAEKFFIFLAAAHDLGKATPVFQVKGAYPTNDLDNLLLEGQIRTGLPMPTTGEKTFRQARHVKHTHATFVLLEEAGCNRQATAVLGAHHGMPPARSEIVEHGRDFHATEYHMKKQGKEIWTHIQKQFIEFALQISGVLAIENILKPAMNIQVLLSGLVIMADWIASNERYFPYIQINDNWEEMLMSANFRTRSANGWSKLNLPKYWLPAQDSYSIDIYKERFGTSQDDFVPYAMQAEIHQTACSVFEPGIVVLEAQPGSGKTEAALVVAEIYAQKSNRSGIFFALPTQATSDGIFPRVNRWAERLDEYGEHSIKLAHGKAQFNDQYVRFLEGSKNIDSYATDAGGLLVHQWFEGQKNLYWQIL